MAPQVMGEFEAHGTLVAFESSLSVGSLVLRQQRVCSETFVTLIASKHLVGISRVRNRVRFLVLLQLTTGPVIVRTNFTAVKPYHLAFLEWWQSFRLLGDGGRGWNKDRDRDRGCNDRGRTGNDGDRGWGDKERGRSESRDWGGNNGCGGHRLVDLVDYLMLFQEMTSGKPLVTGPTGERLPFMLSRHVVFQTMGLCESL